MSTPIPDKVTVTKEQIEALLDMSFTQGKTDTAGRILCDLIFQLKAEIESLKVEVHKNKINTVRV